MKTIHEKLVDRWTEQLGKKYIGPHNVTSILRVIAYHWFRGYNVTYTRPAPLPSYTIVPHKDGFTLHRIS